MSRGFTASVGFDKNNKIWFLIFHVVETLSQPEIATRKFIINCGRL